MGSKWVAETSESPEFVGELAKARPFPKPRAGCSTHPGATLKSLRTEDRNALVDLPGPLK